MYTMYMKYTVKEFRDNLREALNAAEHGTHVYVERYGVLFQLVKQPSNFSVDEEGEKITLLPAVKKNRVAQGNITTENLTEVAKAKGMKFCANGHAIPAGRSKCMGKGCKYA